MIDIESFIERVSGLLSDHFADNLLFLGLQGSYGRGEANDGSEIDLIVIFRECTPQVLQDYRAILDSLEEKDLVCGFVSSLSVLSGWDRGDRALLILDTRNVIGDLASLLPPLTEDDIRHALKESACAINHAACHNFLHARDMNVLMDLFKGARFVVRLKHLLDTGIYISRFCDLFDQVGEEARRMLGTACAMDEDSLFLIKWTDRLISGC